MPRLHPLSLIAAATFLLVPLARAGVVDVSMDGSFNDGGGFVGDIDYNPDTITATGWDLITYSGNTSKLPNHEYTPSDSTFQSGGTISGHQILELGDGSRFFAVTFNPDVTDAGGSTNVYISTGNSAEYSFSTGGDRNITSGSATGTPIPEPASLSLLGLTGCLLVRRRRAASATNN